MFGATFGIFYCLGWCRATVWQFSSMLCGFGRHLWAACRGAMHASDVRLSGRLHGFFRCDFGYLRHILGHLQVFSVISMAQVAIYAPFKQCSVILGKIKEHCLQWPLFRHVHSGILRDFWESTATLWTFLKTLFTVFALGNSW